MLRRRQRRSLGLIVMIMITLGCVMLSLAMGSKPLPFNDVWLHFWRGDQGQYNDLVINLRESRTLTGLLVGAALALAGTLTQGLMRNPLAEPGILGVNAGAAAMVVGFSFFPLLEALPRFWPALGGATLATALFFLLGGGQRHTSPARLVLTGAAINACLFAFVQSVVLLNARVLDSYRFWTVGSLSEQSLQQTLTILPWLALLLVLVPMLGGALNVLAFGENSASALGVNVARVRLMTLVAATVLAAAATAMAGPIAFIGLAAPHLMRALVGSDYRWLLPYSAFAGASLLLLADVLARWIIAPQEIMVGIVTACLGGILLWAVAKRSRRFNDAA
ncbi:iron ABC transporter permease [Enterobacterales bacterium CwR94]|nr:iron ABC transporter permease [Enterobacterales bacterium CwR94]